MRQKDHFYIDGADVDGDKVFLYQNMPKEFLDAVKAKKDNLELNGIMKQNKAEEFNPEYDLSASNPAMKRYINSKASQYMPNALYRTGRSSFVGKDGMGQVVTAKEYLGIVFSDIMKKGGVINIPLFDKKGNQYAVLKGRMDPNDLTKMDGYFTHAVEASSRTADSSTYYDLIDPRQMQNKLLKKGMPNARLIAVKNGKETGKLLFDSVKKKPVELEYRMLRDSRDYGDLFTLKNAIYNGKDFAGRKYKLREVQEILEKAEGMDKTFQSSLAYLSANMSRHKLNTNLLRLMDYKTYNRLLESVNKAMKENPAIGEAIKRNTMLIRPDYGKYRSKNENVTDRELEQILKLNDATDLHSILMVTKAEELLSKDMMAKGIGRDEINRITMDMALKAVEHKDALVKVRKLSSIHKKNVNINQLSDVEKMIRDYKREIKDIANQYDMPSNRFTDFYEMYMLGSLYPQSKPSKQVEMENKAILDTGREVQKRRKSGKENLDYELSYLQEKVDNHLKHFNKTSQHRYPYESNEISNKNKKIFISSFGNTFNLMRGRSEILQEVAKEPAVQQIKERVKGSEEGPKTEQQKDQQLKEDINDYLQPQANLFDFKVEGKVQAPADVKKAARDIVDIFKQFGEHSQEHLSDMFVAMTNARDGVSYGIEKATFRDIKDFRNFLQDQLHAGAKDGKPSILTQFLFPRRIAEKQFIHDWQTAETIKGLPFRDIKGNYGWTDIRVPLGTMKGLQNSFRNVYNMQNSSINYGQEERDKHFWIRKDILDLPDGVAKAQELQDLAMKHYLQDAGQRMQLEYNQAQWQKSKKAYEKLSKEEFTIVRDNKRVQVSGKEMMDIVAESNASYLKGLYNKWVKSGLDFTLIDPDAELQLTANYKAFNKQSPLLKYNETTGKSNVETLFKTLIDPITKGKQNFDRLIGKGGFTTELLYRLQYEYQLEKFIRENKPSNPKKFREDYRQTKSEIFEEADQVTKYIRSKTAFAGVGEVKDKYWPHMFHMDTVTGRKEAEAFMERKRNELQLSLQDQIAKEMGVLKETGFEYTLDERFPLTKSDRSYIISGEQSESIAVRGNPNKIKGGTQKSRAYEIIDRKTAELENMFEQTLGSALTADNGSGEHGARWLLGKYANKEEAVNDGFFSRPGSGRARGKEPMPGFSYDFKVIEAYQDQWINAFYKSATALASKKQIDLYEQANPLKDKKLTEEWSNIMKDYASDVMGYDGMYSRSELSLSKQQLAERRSLVKRYESGKSIKKIGDQAYKEAKEDLKIHNRIKNKIGDTINNAFYYVGDKAVVNGLEKLSKKFWMGGEENAPKLPIWGELPKSPEARRKTLSRIANQIGNAEAKFSLISLLSHPKTAIGNYLGGSHNTISNAGLSNFVDASFNRKKLLATIFRGAKLKDGTPITTKDHLIRFAEENGAIESFMITEGSLERNFQFKEAKAMLSELTNFRKKNPDKTLSIGEIRDLAKKYKVTEAAVQAGAIFMRKSERKLRTDSFYAHYLNSYNNLRSVIPDLRYDNPYVLNMALKGVEATQFLYHSAFRPKYSRTSLGKVLTRFHPFAWNSIRFRRLTYKRAKRYGFREGTQDFNTMRRLLTLDMFALAMANVFVSSIFDSTLPPPLSWMQDASDWMFGDEKERDRAFFSSWPHPALAPLQIATPPVARFALTPINAMINGNWDRFADYYLWTFFPFGRLGRSVKKTFEVPEMWLEQMTGIPIHAYAREIDKT
jgi:osmotically-inducible protein OsmY